MIVIILLAIAIVIGFLFTAAVVKLASMVFGFTFSWLIVLLVYLIAIFIKSLFNNK